MNKSSKTAKEEAKTQKIFISLIINEMRISKYNSLIFRKKFILKNK